MSFVKKFEKTAVAVVTMTPEEYFKTVGEKDPLVGALAGGAAGAARGLAKHRTAKAGLIGAAAGTVAGGAAGYGVGKAYRKYQTNKVHHLSRDLKLRSTPSRSAYRSSDEE